MIVSPAMVSHRGIGTLILGLSLIAPTLTACGPEEPLTVKANVKPGPMPEGGSWHGVYYDQTYGHLHLVAQGTSATGSWRTTAGEKWGELHGSIDGDLLRFKWEEHRIGMFGPSATSHGNGYFKYVVPAGDNVDHEINGEWGLNDDEAGNPWAAIKQRNMEPDPTSVRPDETQTTVDGGDWDSGKSNQASGGAKKKDEAEEDME